MDISKDFFPFFLGSALSNYETSEGATGPVRKILQ
jgi:hypothetical protein